MAALTLLFVALLLHGPSSQAQPRHFETLFQWPHLEDTNGLDALDTLPSASVSLPDLLVDSDRLQIQVAPERFLLETMSGEAPSSSQIADATRILGDELSRYPAECIGKTDLRKIVLVSKMRSEGVDRSGMSNGSLLFLDVSVSPDFLRLVFHHEMFHTMDHGAVRPIVDTFWESLNPPGFTYDPAHDQGEHPRSAPAAGFVTRYGMTSVEDDSAEVFSLLMVAPEKLARASEGDPILTAKISEMRRMISGFCPALLASGASPERPAAHRP